MAYRRWPGFWHDLMRSRRGAAAVEFGLVIPILLFLVLGTVEIGRMLYHNHIVTKTVRDTARFLARMPITGTSCADYALDAAYAGSGAAADRLIRTGQTANAIDCTAPGINVLVPGWCAGGAVATFELVDCVTNTGQFRGGADIPIVRVTATVPYNTAVFGDLWGANLTTFKASHEQRYLSE